PHHDVVSLDQLPPAAVTELDGAGGRVDDVGEHHGCQHAVGLEGRAGTGEKLLDLFEDRVGVSVIPEVVLTRKLAVPRPRYLCREVTTGLYDDDHVPGSVQDQRWHADYREDVSNVRLEVHPGQRHSRGGTSSLSQIASE